MAMNFGQGLIQSLINPSYGQGLFTAGQAAGQFAAGIPQQARAAQEQQRMREQQQQAGLLSAYQMGAEPGGADPAAAMAAIAQGTGASAPDLVKMMEAGRAAGQRQAQSQTEQRKRNGLSAIASIATNNDVSDPRVRQSMQNIAIQTGLSLEEVNKTIEAVTPAAKERKTDVIERVGADGYMHRFLIDSNTGEDIRDLGRSQKVDRKVEEVDGKFAVIEDGQLTGTFSTKSEAEQEQIKQGLKVKAGNVIVEIDRGIELLESAAGQGFLGMSGLGGAAGFGALLNWLPTSDANALRGVLKTVKGNIGLDELKKLKAEGGTLGQISNFELETLQSIIASLDQTQDEEIVLENLRKIRESYRRIIAAQNGELPLTRVQKGDVSGYTYRVDENRMVFLGDDGTVQVVERNK